jgi:SAM-dependent methyltransferase
LNAERPSPADFIANVVPGDDGVWRTPDCQAVSYPADGHDACLGVEDRSFWFEHRLRCIEAMVARHAPDRARPFLDVGGGNGFVAARLQALGWRAVLVEPGARGVANARGRGVRDLVQAATGDLEIAPGSIGAAGLFDVLEHLERPEDVLRSLHAALAPGGRVFATVPAHAWLWSSVDVQAGHFRRYSRGTLGRLFEATGYRVDQNSYYFWLLPAPMFLLRAVPERLGRRGGGESRQHRVDREHTRGGGLARRLLAAEPALLARGVCIPFGASLIIAATRIEGRRG